MKKNKLYKPLVFLLMAISMLLGTKTVQASTEKLTLTYSDWFRSYTAGGVYSSWYLVDYSFNGRTAYCIEPEIENGTYYQTTSDFSITNYTNEQKERALLIAYYGYDFPGHQTRAYRAATQALLWENAGSSPVIFSTQRYDNGMIYDISSERNEIERLVSEHYKKPSFNGQNFSANVGETITLTDENNVLSNYEVYSSSNAQVSINGNKLTVKPTTVGKINIKFVKKQYTSQPYLLYHSPNEQTMLSAGAIDPVYSDVNISSLGGKVDIVKLDKDSNTAVPQGEATLKGAVYGIYDADTDVLIEKITTNEKGIAMSNNLSKLGKFYLKEITASKGYQLDNTKYYFTSTLESPNASIKVKEEVVTRDFRIIKVIASDKTQIMTPESNVRFGIYDRNNKLIKTLTTDEEGKITFNLPYGHYTLKQLNTPSGYEKIKDYNFEVKDLGATINKVFSNAEITARVKVVKVDQDGKIITRAGIKFKIKDLSTGKYICQTVAYPNHKTYCEFETDKNGILITPYPLNSGDYQLEEVDQRIDGYLWNSNPLKFSINENSNIQTTEDFDAILELKFTNQEVKGKIELHKKGEQVVIEDGKFTYKDIPLPNVTFGLYDANGNLIGEYKTDSKGNLVIEGLKLGKYTLKELKTLNGYVLDKNVYTFELAYKDQYTPVVVKTFNLKNKLKKSDLEFSKTDLTTGKGIKNTKVKVYTEDDKLVFTGITDKNGKIVIKNLFVGKFYIVETEAATGYRLSDEKVYFEITEDGKVVKANMTNEKIKGTLEFTKQDLSNDEALPNTLIEIYNAETDELVFSGRTDEEGKIVIKDLEYGKYYILEKEAPEGYTLNDEKMYFEILEDGKIVKSTMKDEKIKGTLEFTKQDLSNDEALPNTLIEIYNAETDELVFSGRTDEEGKIVIKDLEYGKYYILEKEAPEGYTLNDEKMYFEILEDGKVVKANMKDEKIVEVPDTFKNDYLMLGMSSLIIVGAGIVAYGIIKKKKSQK